MDKDSVDYEIFRICYLKKYIHDLNFPYRRSKQMGFFVLRDRSNKQAWLLYCLYHWVGVR